MPGRGPRLQPAWVAPLERAIAQRQPLFDETGLDTFRLVNGAGDGLPGLAVDRYGQVAVLHAYDPAVPVPEVAEALLDMLPEVESVYAKRHPAQPSRTSAAERQDLAPATPELGMEVEALLVTEHGVRYEIRPGAGLSVGLFLDMREVRQWVREQTRGQTVLNLFAYTCAFGVCASLGGAARVLNLDLSKPYLAWGQANYQHNRLSPNPRDFVFGDAFDWLARFARRGEQFDVVILDPPSFSTSRRGQFAAEADYGRLAAAALRVVRPGGIFVAATNHAGIAAGRFSTLLARACDDAGQMARPLQQWHEPRLDFPVAPADQPYLKVQALEVTR